MNDPSQSDGDHRRWIQALGWTLVGAVLLIPWTGMAGFSLFLELDGIQGEATETTHKGAIEVVSWSWGASQSATTHTGSTSTTNRASVQDLSLTKYIDKSSPALLSHVLKGDLIHSGRLEVVEEFSKGSVTVQSLDLEDILVTSQSAIVSAIEDQPTEAITLNFAKFIFTDVLVAFEAPVKSNSIYWDIPQNTGSGGVSNSAPTISDIADQPIPEDGSITVNFSIGDSQSAAGALVLSRSSSNPTVVPVSGITLGGEGTDRTLTIVPAPNQVGASTIVITVSDGLLSVSDSFVVTVTPGNDPPVIDPILTQVMTAHSTLEVDVFVSDLDSDLNEVELAAIASSAPALLPLSAIGFSGTGNLRTMTLTPMPGQSGVTEVTIGATDGEDPSAPQTFTLVVNESATGTPTDIALSGNLVPENSPNGFEIGVLSTADPDGGDVHTYSLLDDAGGRFGIGGDRLLVADGSMLDYEATSSHFVTVRTEDLAGNALSKGFLISVVNVNEGPSVVVTISLLQAPPDIWKPVGGVSFADPDVGGGNVSVLLEVSSGILYFDGSAPFSGTIGGNGTNALSVECPLNTLNTVLTANGLFYRNTDLTALGDTLSMHISDLGNTGAGGPLEVVEDLPIQISLTKYEIWLRDYYTSLELADPAISGFSADSDGDTLSTLFEYLLNLTPTLIEPGPHVEVIEVEVAGESYPAVRLQRLKTFYDHSVSLEVQVATDLSDWAEDVVLFSSETSTYPYDEVVIRSVFSLTDCPVQEFRMRGVLNPTF